jgi:hypothetical protein
MARQPSLPDSSDIAAALGTLSDKVAAWKQQRAAIATELRRLAELANAMLRELGGDGAPARRGGRPHGYRASAATRAKLRAAWKRRKAKSPATPRRTLSADGRARIAAAQRKRWADARKAR